MAAVLRFHPDTSVPKQWSRQLVQIFMGFWLLGLINNSAYVIMIAGANEIASSAVGLVYFCAIGPTIVVKLTAPYWFHLVSYSVRFWVAALLMTASFCTVGLSSNTTAQLLGVALVAVQGGLGEASALGLCSLHPNQLSLTAWSSGTGFAGVMGYAWVAVLHYWLQLSYTVTLLIATVMPGIWLAVFHALMRLSQPYSSKGQYSAVAADDGTEALLSPDRGLSSSTASNSSRVTSPEVELSSPASSAPDSDTQQQQQQQQEQFEGQSLNVQQQQQQHLRVNVQHLRSSQQEHCAVRRCSSQQQPQQDHGRLDQSVALHVPTSSINRTSLQHGYVAADREVQQEGCGGIIQYKDASATDPQCMTGLQRFKATCALWPYMVPLFVVYFAEVQRLTPELQQRKLWVPKEGPGSSGGSSRGNNSSSTCAAVPFSVQGFPVTSPQARRLFYLYSNWLYQAGVCISRSSGMLFQANRTVLWIMPFLQCLLLVFFSIDAVLHVWWNWWLLVLCFAAGLLGGAVYVNSFTLMSLEVEPALKEFSLSAACVADSFGIAAADLTAIFIQGCLFKLQGLEGAAFACGASKL